MLLKSAHKSSDATKVECIKCMIQLFRKEPFIILNAYENAFDFSDIIDAVKNPNPDVAIAGMDFWTKFITMEQVTFKEDFKKTLFEK